MKKLQVNNFSLAETLDSGQIFRYWKAKGGYIIGQRDKLIFVRQTGDVIEFEGCDKKYLTELLGLDEPHDKILFELSSYKELSGALKECSCIRLMKQNPWECLIGFMCSSMSNIPKIKKNMELLGSGFGRPFGRNELEFREQLSGDESEFREQSGRNRALGGKEDLRRETIIYSFPSPGEINDLKKIRSAKTGFRDRFIFDANQRVTDKWLEGLKKLSYIEAREELMKLNGVGSKIADCVLLFSLGFKEPFPVDVQIERAINELYPQTRSMTKPKIEEFCRSRFGKNAGYAQQIIYCWRRKS